MVLRATVEPVQPCRLGTHVDQRQELLGGVRVALLDGGQDACHFAHGEPRLGGRASQTRLYLPARSFASTEILICWRGKQKGDR
jgi:hypothetical protein